MQSKRTLTVYGLATAFLLVAVVILANIVSSNLFGRLDMSEGRIYSLSSASRTIVGGLQDDFVVKAYFSKSLPPPYNGNAKYVQDLLQDYKSFGKGRFRFTFVDPGDDTKLEQEAQKYRIPPVQVQVLEQDQFQAKKVYMGLVFLYRDRQEILPVIDKTDGLEYDITANIKKLTSDKQDLPVVGFLSGHDEPSMDQLQTVQQVFQKQYRMRAVSVANGQSMPADVQVLVIASPRRDLSQWERYAVDQYMMRGGKVAFLLDKVDANLQYQQAMPLRLGMDSWTEAYGFKINDNLLGDLQNPGTLTVSQQEGFFRFMSQVPFPFIPSLRNFNKSNVLVKDLERVSLYFASSIDTSTAKAKGLTAEPLILTSPKTMVQERTYNINPMQHWTKEQFDKGQQVVAAVIAGKFTSAFKGQPVPAATDSSAAAAPLPGAPRLDESPESRLVVVGDGEFFSDQKGGGDPVNVLFFQNMVDWLAQDEALISIRSREVTDRPLRPVSEPTKRFVKYANILGSPLLVALLGVAVWQGRKRRKVTI